MYAWRRQDPQSRPPLLQTWARQSREPGDPAQQLLRDEASVSYRQMLCQSTGSTFSESSEGHNYCNLLTILMYNTTILNCHSTCKHFPYVIMFLVISVFTAFELLSVFFFYIIAALWLYAWDDLASFPHTVLIKVCFKLDYHAVSMYVCNRKKNIVVVQCNSSLQNTCC